MLTTSALEWIKGWAMKWQPIAKQLPGIAATAALDGDILASLTDNLKETGANRVVFASCSPVIHQGLIEEALKLSGLNPYLYEYR